MHRIEATSPTVRVFCRALRTHPDLTQHVGAIVDPARARTTADNNWYSSTALRTLAGQRLLRPYRRRREWLLGIRWATTLVILGGLDLAVGLLFTQSRSAGFLANHATGIVYAGVVSILFAVLVVTVQVAAARTRSSDGMSLAIAYGIVTHNDELGRRF